MCDDDDFVSYRDPADVWWWWFCLLQGPGEWEPVDEERQVLCEPAEGETWLKYDQVLKYDKVLKYVKVLKWLLSEGNN